VARQQEHEVNELIVIDDYAVWSRKHRQPAAPGIPPAHPAVPRTGRGLLYAFSTLQQRHSRHCLLIVTGPLSKWPFNSCWCCWAMPWWPAGCLQAKVASAVHEPRQSNLLAGLRNIGGTKHSRCIQVGGVRVSSCMMALPVTRLAAWPCSSAGNPAASLGRQPRNLVPQPLQHMLSVLKRLLLMLQHCCSVISVVTLSTASPHTFLQIGLLG